MICAFFVTTRSELFVPIKTGFLAQTNTVLAFEVFRLVAFVTRRTLLFVQMTKYF